MFLKALGVKYLSRYKSYHAPWIATLEVGDQKKTFRIDEFLVSADGQIVGRGYDEMGTFKIFGTVNKQGFAEFEKRYTTGGLKPMTSFHGTFTNAMIRGNWVIKGQGAGMFDMKMEGAQPYALKVGNLQEVIYLKYVKDGSRIHSVGVLNEHTGQNKRFFILNGKFFGENKGEKEFAMKFLYPDSSDQDYYLGALTEDQGTKRLVGKMEIHSKKEWFSKGKSFPFEIVELTQIPSPKSNLSVDYLGDQRRPIQLGKMQLPFSPVQQGAEMSPNYTPLGPLFPPQLQGQYNPSNMMSPPGTQFFSASETPENTHSPLSPYHLAQQPVPAHQPPKTS